MATTLVLGGPRSGKSRHAQSLLRDHDQVTYVATLPGRRVGQDTGPGTRVQRQHGAHPGSWRTVETLDLTRALLSAREPVLVDCLTAWVQGHLDGGQLWEDPGRARETLDGLLAELAVAARASPFPVVLVGQELLWGPLPDDPRRRLLMELNAHVNQVLSASCHQVHVVLGGRVLDLSDAPAVGARDPRS